MTDPTDTDTTEPRETPDAPAPPPPPERGHTTSTGRKVAVAGVAAAVALAGFAGGLVVAGAGDDAAAADPHRERGGAEVDLGSVTVEELADVLAEHGLVLDIAPESFGPEEFDAEELEGEDPGGFEDEGSEDPEDGLGEEFDEGGVEPRPVATFPVRGNELVPNGEAEEVTKRAEALWGRFTELIPADQRRMVSTFELMDDDYQGAHVYPDEADPTRWVLGIGEGLGDDLDATVIHEFGHLLTLQAGQVPPDPDAEDSCATYFTGEGCALSSSTFARFVERFWPPEMLDTLERIEAIEDDAEYYRAQEKFYSENTDRFVTEYAVTNPGEDLAETFAEFVLTDRPSGNTVSDQKIRFLWDDPALTALRDEIRSRLP